MANVIGGQCGDCGQCGCGPYDCGCGPSGCDCNSCDMGCGQCDCGCGPCDEGCEVDCGMPCDCGPNMCCKPRFTMFGDFLYLQATDVDVAHAQQQDGLGGAGTVPFGDIGTIGQDFNPGFRVGGTVACGPCSGVGHVVHPFRERFVRQPRSADQHQYRRGRLARASSGRGAHGVGRSGRRDLRNRLTSSPTSCGCSVWQSGCNYALNYIGRRPIWPPRPGLLADRHLRRRIGRRDRHLDDDRLRRRRHQGRRRCASGRFGTASGSMAG